MGIFDESYLLPIHWLLAFSGAFLHLLSILAVKIKKPDFSPKALFKEHFIGIITTIVMIPTTLIVIADTSLKELMPINNLTAFLVGYQVQEIFNRVIAIASNKYKLKSND